MPASIIVEGLSKRYEIGALKVQGGSLRDSLTNFIRSPLGRLMRNGANGSTQLWALKNLNFEVKKGELVGIIGRNGAGKSTLLRILSRITEPTTGRVRLYGRIGSLLEVGTGFHPELTGRENIFLNGAIIGMRRADITRRFDEIVAFSEIERFIDTPVKRYSSGMYTRLAFAVAAHLEPEILIIDEVLAVGDLAFQKKCIGKMSDVAGHGRTVLFVSHSMESIRKICSRAILLDQGEIVCDDRTEAAIAKYIEEGAGARAFYEIPPPSEEANAPGHASELVIEDAEGNPAKSISVGRPWQIRVRFEIVRPVEHFIIAIGLVTNNNMPLRTSWSVPCDMKPGKYEAIFREETLVLSSGRYSITLGLSSFEQSFHYVPDAGAIQIAEFSEDLDLVRVSNCGYLLNPLQISIQKL